MGDLYTKRAIFLALMIVSLLTGALFFVTNNIDFIIAAVDQDKFHIPNIAYAITRTISGVLLPAVFVAPTMFPYGRIKLTKILFIIYGIAQLFTITWIFYFLSDNSFADLFNIGKIVLYQANGENAFVSSYVYWDTYSWIANIFTILYSSLCIWIGICFDDNRKKVRMAMIVMLALRWLFPLISSFIEGRVIWSTFWLVNNYLDLISCIAYVAAMCVAAMNDTVWINIVWEQEYINDIDDEEFSSGLPEK